MEAYIHRVLFDEHLNETLDSILNFTVDQLLSMNEELDIRYAYKRESERMQDDLNKK